MNYQAPNRWTQLWEGEAPSEPRSHRGAIPRRTRRPNRNDPPTSSPLAQPLERRLQLTAAPDPSFGTAGAVVLPNVALALDVVAAPDGDILAVAEAGGAAPPGIHSHLVRINADGTPDTAFGNNGVVDLSIGGPTFAQALALQNDGKILVAGNLGGGLNGQPFVARFNPDGSPDPAFATDGGAAVTALGYTGGFTDLLALDDGRVLASGHVFPSGQTPEDALLVMLNTDGTIDSSFASAGLFISNFPGQDTARRLAQAPDGGFLFAGYWDQPFAGGGNHSILGRLLPSGALDPDFGATVVFPEGIGPPITDGVRIIKSRSYYPSLAVHPLGEIYFGASDVVTSEWSIHDFLPSGAEGISRSNGFGTYGMAMDVLVQENGLIIQAGQLGEDFAVVRYTHQLDVEHSFGPPIRTDFDADPSTLDRPHALALHEGGLLAAGSANGRFALVRYVLPPQLTLTGTDGDDTISMEFGADAAITVNGVTTRHDLSTFESLTLDAGAGNDTIDIPLPGEMPDGIGGRDWLTVYGGAGHDSISARFGGAFYGGDGDDTLTAAGKIFGGPGNDTLTGNGFGGDLLSDLDGGNNLLIGNDGSDTLEAGPGNDTLDGSGGTGGTLRDLTGGDDLLVGGWWIDVIHAGPGHDTARSGNGPDTVYGGDGDDSIDAGEHMDVVYGGPGNDSIIGGESVTGWLPDNDLLLGDAGNDTIDGGAWEDRIWGGDGDDFILGGDGGDTLGGQRGNDTLGGGHKSDYITGGPQNDLLLGKDGSDILIGDTGNDTLRGDSWADRLVGGLGADVLIGGDGADTADYSDHSGPIAVTFDSLANDGSPGERDNVMPGIESVLRPPSKRIRRWSFRAP
jgi:uncharacterized delta-60 repeat protein